MRILMLGNSLTASYNLSKLLSKNLQAEVEIHTRSGARLKEQTNPETRVGSRTQAVLKEETWDYVILQEMSNGPVKFQESYLDSVKILSQQIKENGAKPMIFVTWAYQKDSESMKKLEMSYEQMYQGLQEVCLKAAKENECLVANVGKAFYESQENLYADDGKHPNEKGVEVIVDVLTKTIQENQ